MRSLNARLVAGLLAVTAVGLTLMGLVSAVMLRGYLLHRADNQLEDVRRRPALAHAADTVAPGRYVVLTVTRDGRVRAAVGGPDPGRALDRAARVGPGRLFAEGQRGRPFRFGGMRAVARVNARGNLTVIVDPLTEVHAAVMGLLVVESATGVVLLGLVALLGRRLVRRGLAPLSRMAATAHAIASGGDLSARMEESTSSEVGRLAGAVNVMLGRIEQAFLARLRSEAKVREFAAEASHELRTPLTTIRGYSDLYEQGAVSAEEAMRRISGEAARMGRLVDELLELARLDKGSALSPAPADLAVLARDAVADATVVEPDRPITLDAPDSLVTVADEARIRQVLANLLANVRAHTPPRTPATVRLMATDATVVLEVADEGPGMAPEEAERAFDRFHHARGSDGSGLGLAIVAAIAAAHGGRAALRSAPGAGTVVRVELPRLAPLREPVGTPPHTGPTGG
ncbi:sensor histidine kinase [Actinoallomurus soli]|uniref:sensor histidine kinase n=1 Tax=Actinoallomurus soli TaxID=2952535 RepID=UPI002092B9C6|nr:HAMP domain-containing sensor histidine kinase [Actinoallomurus soli]MCO5968574.1 HAMP domain-containing histidine kinase [Actinoallomurus soli]